MLTRAEIESLMPGIKTDELVASLIMGWERRSDFPWILGDPCGGEELPSFSTDILGAWKIVEKLDNDGWWIRIKSALDKQLVNRGWAVEIGRWWNREGFGTWAETIPLAICRAALMAMVGPDQDDK